MTNLEEFMDNSFYFVMGKEIQWLQLQRHHQPLQRRRWTFGRTGLGEYADGGPQHDEHLQVQLFQFRVDHVGLNLESIMLALNFDGIIVSVRNFQWRNWSGSILNGGLVV
jgi:hypothetical protein